jgi:hypothetical protein
MARISFSGDSRVELFIINSTGDRDSGRSHRFGAHRCSAAIVATVRNPIKQLSKELATGKNIQREFQQTHSI